MNKIPKTWNNLIETYNFIPIIVKTVQRVLDANWSMEPNRHDFFEMVYMKKGEAIFVIENKKVEMGPNNIVIIKPRQSHKLLVKSDEGCEFIVCSFVFEGADNTKLSKVSLEDFLNFVEKGETGAYISIKVSQRNEIILLLNKILKEISSSEFDSEYLTRIMVLELFVHISRALKVEWENSMKYKTTKLKELIKIAVNFIKTNYEKNLTLNDISGFVFLSTSYFTKVFKEEMKISPINYLLRYRIEKAKGMLLETDNKIGDISMQVGFSNQQRFNEIFKKYTHLTPTEYRKSAN